MVDAKDVHGLRLARTEMTKRGIDIAGADLQIRHGIVHLRGVVQPMPGTHIADMRQEVDHIAHVLRQRPEIKEFIVECAYAK